MYYTYENGKLVAKGDQYENPSSYTQYGTGETGANRGQANGWEQGVSNAGTGVLDGMGLGMFAGVGKMGFNSFKQMDNAGGDVMSQFFGPHHVMLGNVDDYKAGMINKKDLGKVQAQNTLGWMLPGIGSIWGAIDQGKRRRDFANNANYVNNTNPFLFALDDKGLQFATQKAKAPAPVGDKTGWLSALGSMVGSGIKQGIDSKKEKNAVAPNTEADLNQDQPKNLAFMQNPLGDNPAIDNSYKESATRFDINRGDNGRDFMYQDKIGAPWDQTYNFKKGGKVNEPIYVNDPKDEKLHSYLDSLNLYNSYQTQLKYNPPQNVNNSFAARYLKPGTTAYDNFVNAKSEFNKSSPQQKAQFFKNNNTNDYWKSESQFKKDVPEDAPLIDAYKKLSFSTPTKTGLWTTPDLYNNNIAPIDIYFGGKTADSGAWNPVYKKPVQPYQYSGNSQDYEKYRSTPTIIGTNQKFNPKEQIQTVSNLEYIPELKRIQSPTFQLNQEQQYLPQSEQHLDFDPIGLKKGTYFTRPRQQQEAGQGNVVDYFDSKTGKLLKTINYKKGGSVQVKGGKGSDDIALVDTNTGEDTGVRVEKDEMIVFSKKNVEALEKAIASGKKNDVFKIVKDQLSQHPEVKEGEKGFSGGGRGKLSKEAQLHLDNPNIRSEAYLRGAFESALKSQNPSDMADYDAMREAHEHILKMDSIKGQERKKEIDSLKSSPKILDKIHGYGKDLLGFRRGGKYKGLSDAEVKKMYHDETAKPFGQVVINNLWDLEKEMDSRKMPYKEWHYLSDEARKAIDDFVAVPANTVKGALWDVPLAISKKVDNYGDPIKDPEGYKHILQTKAEQLYIKRYGEPKVDLGGLGMKFDRKKLKEIEDEIRVQDIEKAKKGENINKVLPSDNEKPTYKDRSAKDALGMLFPDAEKAVQDAKKAVQDAKNKKDGIPVVSGDPAKDNKGIGWTLPNPRTSTSSRTTTTTASQQSGKTDNVNIDDKSIAMKGVTQPDPSMLNVADIAGKLQTPYAKTINTEPETVKQDWLGDTLGYAGDALKLGLGMSAATKKLPEWTISDNWNEYMGKLKFMSNMGLSPEQKAQYLDTADRTYQYDVNNIYNLANGNAGTVLGNLGRANMSRYRSGVDLAIADKNAELANNAVYGNWLGRDEQYRKSIFDENRNSLLMTKQAGMQLASDALANMENRADYNKFYGKGSQVEKLQNLQLEEQQTKNDILKAQKENASNPDFWKTNTLGKTTGTESGTNLLEAVKGATPEQIEALKKLWS